MRKLRKLFLISLPSLFITLLILEILLRLLVPVADPPKVYFDRQTDIIRFEPNQRGVFARQGEFAAEYRINGAGWTSDKEYKAERVKDETRIAIIGDSYVEALQVDYDKNLAVLLENRLLDTGSNPVVVYRFGISGAPLSQYLHMMRYVSTTYAPDIYIINMVYNDFEESFRANPSQPSFLLQFAIDKNNEIVELPITPYTPSTLRRLLSYSAIVRYLYFNLGFDSRVEKIISGNDHPERLVNPPVGKSENRPTVELLLRYVFQQFLMVAAQTDSQVLVTIDAPRASIEAGLPVEQDMFYIAYNTLATDVSADLGVPFLDLTPYFLADFEQHKERFSFSGDGHWNERGHRVAGEAIAQKLIDLGWIDVNATESGTG
jgi:hypothetical protein